MKFIELWQRAKDELGAKYNVRALHDGMLNGGALTLHTLEARTTAWIQTLKSGKAAEAKPKH